MRDIRFQTTLRRQVIIFKRQASEWTYTKQIRPIISRLAPFNLPPIHPKQLILKWNSKTLTEHPAER
jgi:hypothetical protein